MARLPFALQLWIALAIACLAAGVSRGGTPPDADPWFAPNAGPRIGVPAAEEIPAAWDAPREPALLFASCDDVPCACDCGPKIAALEARVAALESKARTERSSLFPERSQSFQMNAEGGTCGACSSCSSGSCGRPRGLFGRRRR